MPNRVLLIAVILLLFSCKHSINVEDIDRNKFCNYFSLKTGTYKKVDTSYPTISPQINNIENDKVSSFIEDYPHRFDYIINKSFVGLSKKNHVFDSSVFKQQFCKAISTDSFYYNFTHLTSSNKSPGFKPLRFTKADMIKVAARFFMCDRISEKDTAIAYKICVGLNGVSELTSSRDYTILEALCFEAIFRNLQKKPAFVDNFHTYIIQSSHEERKNFSDFKSHLTVVKNKCYALMEKDKDLEKAIMSYYKQNRDIINFVIE